MLHPDLVPSSSGTLYYTKGAIGMGEGHIFVIR